MLLVSSCVIAQTPVKPVARTTAAHKANELTLAGLRPGRDTLQKAKRLYEGHWLNESSNGPNLIRINGTCTGAVLRIEADEKGVIQHVVLAEGKDGEKVRLHSGLAGSCADLFHTGVNKDHVRWLTGQKVGLQSTAVEVRTAYGEPDSRSPSTKDGQPLELMYYAFDWAGPEVPQVMEVLCTVEKDGKPGRVVEITLAAPSL